MKRCFADTSFYVALLNQRDGKAELASAFAGEPDRVFITTELVLVEAGNWFSMHRHRILFVRLMNFLRSDSGTTVVPASTSLLQRAFDLYAARLDKDWSLTDCISFEVMREQSIADALTTDHHFEQAGFRALLK